MYSSTLPSTSVLDEGGWSTPRPGSFTPGKDPVPVVQEGGWAPRVGVDKSGKSRPPPEFDPRTVQPVRVAIPAELSGPPIVVWEMQGS